MSIIGIGGAGIGLPFPNNSFNNNAQNGTNEWILPAGSSMVLPSGTWALYLGPYTFVQVLDPISGLWRMAGGPGPGRGPFFVNADGNNYRVINPTGCPMGAVITNAGTGYTSAPTVTASAGGSTWAALINSTTTGFSLSDTVTLVASGGVTGGSGYTIAPQVFIAPPPPGGIQATAYATISGGAVTTVTIVDNGAGYFSAPAVTFVTDPLEASPGNIVPAAATTALGTSGLVSAVYPTSFGTPQTSLITLSFAGGGGASAAATVVGCFSATGLTTGTAGATVAGTAVDIVGVGGATTATAAAGVKQPSIGNKVFMPRRLQAYAPVSGGAVGTGVIVDAGLYQAAPTIVVVSATATASAGTAPAVTAAIGGVTDTFWMQPVL